MNTRNTILYVLLTLASFSISGQTCPDNKHPHVIDLGLPSGTKWSCCNVGANQPQDTGSYYAWAEIEEKEVYSTKNYDYHKKGNLYSRTMHITGEIVDVAFKQWGSQWQMPTIDQFKELLNNCKSEWKTINGVNGKVFIGNNGNSIFLPAGGQYIEFSIKAEGKYGYYWSDTQYSRQPNYTALYFYFGESNCGTHFGDLCIGRTVRPISSD